MTQHKILALHTSDSAVLQLLSATDGIGTYPEFAHDESLYGFLVNTDTGAPAVHFDNGITAPFTEEGLVGDNILDFTNSSSGDAPAPWTTQPSYSLDYTNYPPLYQSGYCSTNRQIAGLVGPLSGFGVGYTSAQLAIDYPTYLYDAGSDNVYNPGADFADHVFDQTNSLIGVFDPANDYVYDTVTKAWTPGSFRTYDSGTNTSTWNVAAAGKWVLGATPIPNFDGLVCAFDQYALYSVQLEQVIDVTTTLKQNALVALKIVAGKLVPIDGLDILDANGILRPTSVNYQPQTSPNDTFIDIRYRRFTGSNMALSFVPGTILILQANDTGVTSQTVITLSDTVFTAAVTPDLGVSDWYGFLSTFAAAYQSIPASVGGLVLPQKRFSSALTLDPTPGNVGLTWTELEFDAVGEVALVPSRLPLAFMIPAEAVGLDVYPNYNWRVFERNGTVDTIVADPMQYYTDGTHTSQKYIGKSMVFRVDWSTLTVLDSTTLTMFSTKYKAAAQSFTDRVSKIIELPGLYTAYRVQGNVTVNTAPVQTDVLLVDDASSNVIGRTQSDVSGNYSFRCWTNTSKSVLVKEPGKGFRIAADIIPVAE